jgi:hypothetical protein
MGQPLPDPYSDVTAENFPESLGGSHQRDSSYASMTVDDSTKSGRQSYYSSGTEQPYADMPNPFVRDADESRPSKGYQDLGKHGGSFIQQTIFLNYYYRVC